MANLALADLVLPYVLRGENLGPQHAALSVLRVVSFEVASDAFGTVIRGSCEFNGRMQINPLSGGLQLNAGVDEAAPAYDPNRRTPIFDISETKVDFELLVPRAGSAIVAQGAQTITATGFAGTQAVLNNWDTLPIDTPTSDYPTSGFVLDLILKAPTVRPPFLHPAKVNSQGLLEPDTAFQEVALTLPKLRFRMTHGNALNSQLTFTLESLGATSLDDPADFGVAELISMSPPYAFIGGANDRVFGIGFRSATLDLSADSTPPAILSKASVGDDWTGLYLPEVRVFFSPNGARDFAFEAGANELLIGFGPDDGVWGDFEAMLVNQGSGELTLNARFIDEEGRSYGVEKTSATTGTARIPARTRMVVDVSGGRTPHRRFATVGATAEAEGMAFVVDLSTTSPQVIQIRATDSSSTALQATLTITAQRRTPQASLPTPGATPAPPLLATLTAPTDTPVIVMVGQTDSQVILATEPRDPTIEWSVDGGPFGAAQPAITVDVLPGQSHQVRARRPGQNVPSELNFFFYFDEPDVVPDAGEAAALRAYAMVGDNLSTVKAVSKNQRQRLPGHQSPLTAYAPYFNLAPNGSTISIHGHASYENDDNRATYNYRLARRRAISVREAISAAFPTKNFVYTYDPNDAAATTAQVNAWKTSSGWTSHGAPNDRDWWTAKLNLPNGLSTAADEAQATVQRPNAPPPPPPVIEPVDPPVNRPATPDWFRYAKLKVRIVRSQLIAGEIEAEVDFQTATESQLSNSGQLSGQAPAVHSLSNGAPIGPNNPADGITKFRVLCQSDPGTGRVTTLISVGADPADKDGLVYAGWMPGETMPTNKSLPLTLLGSYLSFWPLLAEAGAGGKGEAVDATLTVAALAIPGVIAALPWFQVERVILFGGEYQQKDRGEEFEGQLLFDVGIDWSANILDGLIVIPRDHPLSVRYKAIGLRFGNRSDAGNPQFVFKPIFDSSRGYSIDVASGGALRIGDPLGQILRVLGARLSRTNPLTFEIDIGLGVDLGVITVERASVRAYLDQPRAPELTALQASIDIPGALVGRGYMEIKSSTDSLGNTISTIGGQLDLTLRPVSVRVAASIEVATIQKDGRTATGVYVGLNVILPVGIPLGSSGLGIFGFRGIFGMHYARNSTIGASSGVPALEWLKAAEGQPHLLAAPSGVKLWVPEIDKWSFGLGILIGTMEGGVLMNLDGTFMLELPGPRVLIMLNARLISPPPSVGQLGMNGGILAVIEITPEHFLIGLVIRWEIGSLIKIVIPFEAVFPFPPNMHKWHIYLGARPDIGNPIEVDVLGIVRGTGYLMFKGDGLPAYQVMNATLPEIRGFGIGLGVGATFTWGDTDIGLYLRIGGGMDAVIGFDPFILAGTVYVSGELRLFIISIGAHAQLTVKVNEEDDGNMALYIHGEACGKVSFLFFDIEGCVEITISGPEKSSPMPKLVDKVSLKSRSPALLTGTGVDKGIDVSLGDAVVRASPPPTSDLAHIIVPIDAIPVVSMTLTPDVAPSLVVGGLNTPLNAPAGLLPDSGGGISERGGERYQYKITSVKLERVDPATGTVVGPAVDGSNAPAVWWTLKDATSANVNAQLALMTWEPTPASKAIEKTKRMTDTVRDRWGRICEQAAPAAEVLWTFRWENIGPSNIGWMLEGTSWPDPEHTRRSQSPNTQLKVTERWRSGDATLDAMRGIIPAFVVADLVPCWQPPAVTRPGLVNFNPSITTTINPNLIGRIQPSVTAALRESIVAANKPLLVVGGLGPVSDKARNDALVANNDPVYSHLIRRDDQMPLRITPNLHAKVESSLLLDKVSTNTVFDNAISSIHQLNGRSIQDLVKGIDDRDLQAVAVPTTPAATQPAKQCQVRLLQAPMFDLGLPIVFGDQSKREEVARRLKQLGVFHDDLCNVVVVHSGSFKTLDLLLFCERVAFLSKSLIVRVKDKDGATLQEVIVDDTMRVPPDVLPNHWTDVKGPWVDDIAELMSWSDKHKLQAVHVTLKEHLKADRVEIGVTREFAIGSLGNAPVTHAVAVQERRVVPPYYLAAVSSIRGDEVLRQEWDDSQIKHDQEVVTNVVGPASSNNVLMFPDAVYRLTVAWDGKRIGDGKTASDTQTFWFKTDKIGFEGGDTNKPVFQQTTPQAVKLDPWMLITTPADYETQAFYEEPPKLVFNTHDVDRIFTAYGQELRLRFQASSTKHPKPVGGIPHPMPLKAPHLKKIKGSILSPWEDALEEVLKESGPCIPVDENRDRQSVLEFPIPLEPYTDYIMDVEMVPTGAAADARGPSIYRRHFSTGSYAKLSGLAGSVQSVAPTARSCAVGAMASIATTLAGRQPEGSELDDLLRSKGIEPLGVPQKPRIVVFWSQNGSSLPQPEAVLIDASEPLWRQRPYPKKVIDTTGPEDAERWMLETREWLLLEDKSAAGVVATNGVIRAPGQQRALIVLGPNARGKDIRIDLVRAGFPELAFLNAAEERFTVLTMTFNRAPWEEN